VITQVLLLARSVAEAALFIVDRGVVAEGGPVAVQAVPIVGPLGGAAVNYAFIDHFQEIARAHFTVRRLERRYGKDAVREAYARLSAGAPFLRGSPAWHRRNRQRERIQ
jgi:hypothetical protein